MSEKQNLATPVSAGEAFGLLTKEELAGVLKCSERHVERLVSRRRIPIVRLSTRCVRFRLGSVMNALAKIETEAVLA